MTEKNTPKLQVHISDYDLEHALDAAVHGAIEAHVGKAIESHVGELVAQAINERVKSLTTEMLKAEVERVLTEGWAKTNEWGEKKGEVINLASTVRDALKSFTSENPHAYNREDKPSLLHRTVIALANEAVKESLEPVIAEAKQQLQSQLDISIGKSLRLTLADALKG